VKFTSITEDGWQTRLKLNTVDCVTLSSAHHQGEPESGGIFKGIL